MAEAQPGARNPRNNFYFRDSTIYSYGGHFPIARIVRNAAMEKAVLFTSADSSVTTAGHKHNVRRALDSSPIFTVISPDVEFQEIPAQYRKRIEHEIATVKPRAQEKTKLRIFKTVREMTEEGNRFCIFAGLTERLEMPESLDTVMAGILGLPL